jgi:dienelactone hydrolase
VPLTTRTMAYADQDTPLPGELYADNDGVPRLGILLIHGGGGLDDHARGQASRYAAVGYVVFACDMLGDAVAGDRGRVIGSLTAMRDDHGLLAGRARAGLAELAGCGLARETFAAVGFCFGGLAALTPARSGAGLAAAVSIWAHRISARTARAWSRSWCTRLTISCL